MRGTCQWAFTYCLTYCLPKPWATLSTVREHAVLERLSRQWRLKLSSPCSCTECICVYWRYKATRFSMVWDHGEWSWCDCFTPGEISPFGEGKIVVSVPGIKLCILGCPALAGQIMVICSHTNTDQFFFNFYIYADCMFSSNLTLPWVTKVKRFVLTQHT
jgi:hypothetical protein